MIRRFSTSTEQLSGNERIRFENPFVVVSLSLSLDAVRNIKPN